MKKIILLLIAFMIMGSMCYAADNSRDSVRKINLLLTQNKQLDDQLVYEIGNLASEISTNEQILLVNQYEKSPWGPFAANLILGAGSGSFVQGNSTAGWIELGLELGGIILATGDKVGIVGGRVFRSDRGGIRGICI